MYFMSLGDGIIGMTKVVELLITMQEDSGSSPSKGKLGDGTCKHLSHLSLSCVIMCLLVVSVCII